MFLQDVVSRARTQKTEEAVSRLGFSKERFLIVKKKKNNTPKCKIKWNKGGGKEETKYFLFFTKKLVSSMYLNCISRPLCFSFLDFVILFILI